MHSDQYPPDKKQAEVFGKVWALDFLLLQVQVHENMIINSRISKTYFKWTNAVKKLG